MVPPFMSQIGESLKRFGVNEGCKHLLVARFNATTEEVEQLRDAVHGEPGVLEELAVLSNAEQVRKIYKITAEELQVGSLIDAIVCRIGARDGLL
jgi:EKC/KEOPS complex subunit CGI121/TPRKB